MNGNFRDGAGGTGKLLNPERRYYLKLGAEAAQKERVKTDSNGLNYTGKAMILRGLSLDMDSVWRVSGLNTDLQALIRRNQKSI